MSDKVAALLEDQEKDERFVEVTLKLPSCEIRGKWWGPTNVQPILCFHGWQDNCGVFDRLIPLLPKQFSYLALDSPGHGLSGFTEGTHYSSLDTLLFVENVRMLYGWKKINIIGHSLMASMAFAYAAAFPDRTGFVCFLDNMIPLMSQSIVDHIRFTVDKLHLENERLNQGQEPPSYEFNDLIDRIFAGSFESVNKENCKYLIPRGVSKSTKYPGRYFFRRDARVKYFNGLRLELEENLRVAKKITAPCLYLYGDKSPASMKENQNNDIAAQMRKHNPNFVMQQVPGNHHFILNSPEGCAKFIEKFIYEWSEVKNKL